MSCLFVRAGRKPDHRKRILERVRTKSGKDRRLEARHAEARREEAGALQAEGMTMFSKKIGQTSSWARPGPGAALCGTGFYGDA